MKMHKAKGFTLIEMMVVVVVLAILMAVAMPSYRNYVIRGNRVDVQGQLLQVASNLERYKSQQLSYAGVNLKMVNQNVEQFPVSGKAKYTLTLALLPDATTPTRWVLTASPASGSTQIGDGAMSVDNLGRRCWNPASDSSCDLTNAAQSWNAK